MIFFIMLINISMSVFHKPQDYKTNNITLITKKNLTTYSRDEDPDPVGSGDFWPAGSGSGTFFNGSGSYL